MTVTDESSHEQGACLVDQARKAQYGTCRNCGRPIRLTTSEEHGITVIRARCCPRPQGPVPVPVPVGEVAR
ncbi:hypothetical protein [Streptomyces smyrnaeus]|uniref:hypothetical protein n=1 Tax=Streptomyces smyrnaeus TaxID=1387713 RepID=UPI0033F9ECB4